MDVLGQVCRRRIATYLALDWSPDWHCIEPSSYSHVTSEYYYNHEKYRRQPSCRRLKREGNRWLSSVGADDGWQKTLDVTTLLRPVKIHFAGASRCCALHYSSKNTEDRLGNGEKQNAIPRRATTSTPFLFSPLSHIKNIVDDR